MRGTYKLKRIMREERHITIGWMKLLELMADVPLQVLILAPVVSLSGKDPKRKTLFF